MKVAHYFFSWLMVLAVLVAGVFALYCAIIDIPPALAGLRGTSAFRFFIGIGGLAAVILAVIVAVTSIPVRGRSERYISFEGDAGDVSVSMQAVTDFLVKTAGEFAGVLGLEARITSDESPIEITLDVKIKAGSNIPELSRLLQQHVRASMRETMGITEISAVKVKVKEIVIEQSPQQSYMPGMGDWHNA